MSLDDPSRERRPSPDPAAIFAATPRDFRQRLLTALLVGAFVAVIAWLWGIPGFHDSLAYWRVSWRIWIGVAAVVAVVLYPLFSSARSSGTQADARPSTLASVVTSVATAVGLTLIYAAATPHVLHRFLRAPVQIETTVLDRGVSSGKGGRCPYVDNAVSRQYATLLFCVDRRTYDDAHPGQRIRIDGVVVRHGLHGLRGARAVAGQQERGSLTHDPSEAVLPSITTVGQSPRSGKTWHHAQTPAHTSP